MTSFLISAECPRHRKWHGLIYTCSISVSSLSPVQQIGSVCVYFCFLHPNGCAPFIFSVVIISCITSRALQMWEEKNPQNLRYTPSLVILLLKIKQILDSPQSISLALYNRAQPLDIVSSIWIITNFQISLLRFLSSQTVTWLAVVWTWFYCSLAKVAKVQSTMNFHRKWKIWGWHQPPISTSKQLQLLPLVCIRRSSTDRPGAW